MTEFEDERFSPQWLHRCHALAREARERGDPPVGAVIVREGVLIAEASERVSSHRDTAAHAEMIAIRNACQALGTMRLSDCTLYTSVEPCWMCSFALRETGIGQVVIGTPVSGIGGVTSRYPILTDPDISGWGPAPQIIWAGEESNWTRFLYRQVR